MMGFKVKIGSPGRPHKEGDTCSNLRMLGDQAMWISEGGASWVDGTASAKVLR